MPTATSTVNKVSYSPKLTHKGTLITKAAPAAPNLTTASTTTATLHSLYHRAAKAFLLRDIQLTHSLIDSAFAIIRPPLVIPDALAEHRRKWDILRITLESTVFSSPPASIDLLPKPLQENQIKLPSDLIMTMHARSLALFSPQSETSRINSAYLPSQVLITLVYSSLRLDCPDSARLVIEEWLARRGDQVPSLIDGETKENYYEKVLELYCLQVLPKLGQLDYASEFLDYESELPPTTRESLKSTLKSLRLEMTSSQRKSTALPLSDLLLDDSSRSCSPAPSSSSSSSSLASNSTVVPSTVRPSSHHRHPSSSISNQHSRTSSPSNQKYFSAPQPRQSSLPVLRSRPSEPSSSSSYSRSRFSSPSRSNSQAAALRPTDLSLYSVIKASLAPYLTASNITTFVLLFVVLPLLSFVIRARHRRRQALPGAINNADVARRLLQGNRSGRAGIAGKAWSTVVRVVMDTVKMAGSGLV